MHGFYRKSGRNADVQTKQEKVSPEGARRICSSAADLGLILCEGGAGNTCMVLSRRICAKAGGTPTYRQKQEKVSPEGARRICSSAADLGLILCEGGAGNTCMVLSRRICAKAGGTPTYRQKQEKVSPEGARRICSSAADLGLILCEGGAGNTCMVLSRRICAKADKRCGEVRMRIAPDGRK